MTTQSRIFFVKSFKASDLYRGTVWWVNATYTKRKSIASKYISASGPAEVAGFCSITRANLPRGGLHPFQKPQRLGRL
jgi:hypothetical protein